MPATSAKQQRFMGAELARKRAGKKTRTGMSEMELHKFAMKPKSKMPMGGAMKGPWGDVGEMRQMEAEMVGGFKDGERVCAMKEMMK